MEKASKALAPHKKTISKAGEGTAVPPLLGEVDNFLNGGYLINHLEPLGHLNDAWSEVGQNYVQNESNICGINSEFYETEPAF